MGSSKKLKWAWLEELYCCNLAFGPFTLERLHGSVWLQGLMHSCGLPRKVVETHPQRYSKQGNGGQGEPALAGLA